MRKAIWGVAFAFMLLSVPIFAGSMLAQSNEPAWTAQQKPLADKISKLRSLADDIRPRATQLLAAQIRALPSSANKLELAYSLANLSTEGDQGQDTIQQVAVTLADALGQHPVRGANGKPAEQYVELASLVRYERAQVSLHSAQFSAAMKMLQIDDLRRENINFTLTDLYGRKWTLRELRGKVVLVNFWATWCPPCRKEMPDLNALYKEFEPQGFLVLAISDEKPGTVRLFLMKHKVTYPVLLDPGDRVHKLYDVEGIPKSYVYDRSGKMVAEAMDMRTKGQFLKMLAKTNLLPNARSRGE